MFFRREIGRYDLYVKRYIVNFTGKSYLAIAINGFIPAPGITLSLRWGPIPAGNLLQQYAG